MLYNGIIRILVWLQTSWLNFTMVKITHSSRGIKVWSLNLFIHSMERVLTAICARARSFDKNVWIVKPINIYLRYYVCYFKNYEFTNVIYLIESRQNRYTKKFVFIKFKRKYLLEIILYKECVLKYKHNGIILIQLTL